VKLKTKNSTITATRKSLVSHYQQKSFIVSNCNHKSKQLKCRVKSKFNDGMKSKSDERVRENVV